MNRRELLLGGAAIALSAGTAFANSHEHGEHTEHVGHDMHHHDGKEGLLKAIAHCSVTGDSCAAHCYDLIAGGDTSIIGCLKSVIGMFDVCRATARLATTDSPAFAQQVKTCIAVLDLCEAECRKHGKKHAACLACADACVACKKACQAAIA
jgi:Cys-rich four helix bundle protein (predicted Tat secretion target)